MMTQLMLCRIKIVNGAREKNIPGEGGLISIRELDWRKVAVASNLPGSHDAHAARAHKYWDLWTNCSAGRIVSRSQSLFPFSNKIATIFGPGWYNGSTVDIIILTSWQYREHPPPSPLSFHLYCKFTMSVTTTSLKWNIFFRLSLPLI